MLRTFAVAVALSALAGAAFAQADPYGLPPGYAPVSHEPADDGYPQPKEYTDADYGAGYDEPYAAEGYADTRDHGSQQGYADQGGYQGGHYNSGSSAARRCCATGGSSYGSRSSSSYSSSSYSSSSYASSSSASGGGAYASGGEVELYVAPFAYQRRAEAYYEATGTMEAAAWDRSSYYGYASRYRQDLGDLHLDSSFFTGGLTGGVEGGPPVWVGGGGGGYATSSASASAYAGARAGAFARGGGRRGGKGGGCGCR
ncbi:MAG TPA: hypothetical protein VEA15_07375 [Caulobacteraceae bacterium]|nr:hypothetical protein [Caulobacteraceae bacterium]